MRIVSDRMGMINYDYYIPQDCRLYLHNTLFCLIYFIMTSTLYTSSETSTCKYCLAETTNQH